MKASPAQSAYPPLTHPPRHVGIIMDGNGRWAQARGLPRNEGHRAGMENLRRVLRASVEFGIKILTIYAFSTENWARPRAEVRALMLLLNLAFAQEAEELYRNGVRIRQLGRTEGLNKSLLNNIRKAEELTRDNDRLLLNVAFNYGGRAEIVDAVRQIVRQGIPAEAIDEETIQRHLWTGDTPDPDLIIRTGGDMRLSNFLIWQTAYAEFYVTPAFWPAFGKDELYKALLDYQNRQRRFGALSVGP